MQSVLHGAASALPQPETTAGVGTERAERIRVRGMVQGVGLRPTVWRLAQRHALRGSVCNDGQGVSIHVCGAAAHIDAFVRAITGEAPPLARIESLEREPAELLPADAGFRIASSASSRWQAGLHTGVVPDAATCVECLREVLDPAARRFRYPFTNCTHCGPRLSIIEAIPYDRAATTMASFSMCAACTFEYRDPADRRFHAQPIACPDCGPQAWLESADAADVALELRDALDAVDAAGSLIGRGKIVAVKGLGGFQLACDACDDEAVGRLRQRKRRQGKPFAMMVRDLDVARRYCDIGPDEEALLLSPAAPIVVMTAVNGLRVAAGVAPGVATLGLMLPNTPLHHLLLRGMDSPIVLTSGNRNDEPQCIANDEARERLGDIADYFLLHDRDIARRVDDSVQRVAAGSARMLRRARGYAPASFAMPPGFAAAPPVLAMGGELKNSFCLLREGEAIFSHHMGDLENAPTHADYRRSIAQYLQLFEHEPRLVAVDRHPDYFSTQLGHDIAHQHALALVEVQHHHAHAAACMAENGIALGGESVLAVVLDGLGYGDDGELWGGEFLLADYRTSRRLASFKPVALAGGAQAMREPWRNTYAHLMAQMRWPDLVRDHGRLELCRFLAARPRELLDSMIASGTNSPLASSCGRLFDAAAAAAGVCRQRIDYEGQAAIEFEAAADRQTLDFENDDLAYPFVIAHPEGGVMPHIEPRPMWEALLGDLARGIGVAVISARFHKGLAIVIARMVDALAQEQERGGATMTVALSGGVFQNRVLLEQVVMRLRAPRRRVLTHSRVPTNDGGLALGQAVVAAARALAPG